LYKRQGSFQQLDIGASVHLQPVIIGLYYSGIPFTKDEFGHVNQDVIIVQAGVEYFNFEFGYSFDLNLSRLNPVVDGGAHEFSLIYNFKIPRNPFKVTKSQKRLECPAFIVQRLSIQQ